MASMAKVEATAEDYVRTFINDLLTSVMDDLMTPNGQPSISLKKRLNYRGQYCINPENGALESVGRELLMTYSWPGKTVYEAWRFAISIRILSLISKAMNENIVVSKRDLYYNDPVYFGSQRVVDTLVDDIAYTIGVDRSTLHVNAAAKGLTAGDCLLKMASQGWKDIGLGEEILIPPPGNIEDIDMLGIQWVLVVEKEAIFRKLVGTRYHMKSVAGKGILITGKGYPDLSTRAFIRQLYDSKHQKPKSEHFYILVDSDPDGMDIMSIYKYGSMAHAHENAKLNVPGIQWLGLRTSDAVGEADYRGDDPLIPLTTRDRKKALLMLKNNPAFAEDGPETEWRLELQQMLMLNVKVETEILYEREGGLEGWIHRHMKEHAST